jgi:hypothetical protein
MTLRAQKLQMGGHAAAVCEKLKAMLRLNQQFTSNSKVV